MPSVKGCGRRPYEAAIQPVAAADAATAKYPANSLSPIARPRFFGPARSIFMMTVVDQVRPWLTPSRTFATSTHDHAGAHMRRKGTGAATSHPVTRTTFRPYASESRPAR